jgi:hypothetical protein
MHKRTSVLILSGLLATGVVGAVAITPASATTSTNPVTSRLANIKSALGGLVGDGTLTQSQANKVASTLEKKMSGRGMRGRGGRFGAMGMVQSQDAAAKALGMTPAQLRTALRSGKSMAAIAKDQQVSVDSLVTAMVAVTESQIATAVKNGTMTQGRADKMKASLAQRITDRVNKVGSERGPGGQMHASTSNDPGTMSAPSPMS